MLADGVASDGGVVVVVVVVVAVGLGVVVVVGAGVEPEHAASTTAPTTSNNRFVIERR